MDIIDTHQHLWDLSQRAHAWCAEIPVLNRSFLPEEYAAAVADLPDGDRVIGAVFVEGDTEPARMSSETQWALSLADDPRQLTLGVVAACRPEGAEKDFRADLDSLAGHARLKGLRRILHTQPDTLSHSPLFRENLRTLCEYHLTFDLCVLARQLPVAVQLVRACPEVHFVLDHCGVPDIKGGSLDPWRQHLRELANEPNVIGCKISGLIAYADPSRPPAAADLRPFVEHAIDCFGWDRVMFGGDWPVCLLSAPGSDAFRAWVELLGQLTGDAAADEQRKLWHANAQRVYRLV